MPALWTRRQVVRTHSPADAGRQPLDVGVTQQKRKLRHLKRDSQHRHMGARRQSALEGMSSGAQMPGHAHQPIRGDRMGSCDLLRKMRHGEEQDGYAQGNLANSSQQIERKAVRSFFIGARDLWPHGSVAGMAVKYMAIFVEQHEHDRGVKYAPGPIGDIAVLPGVAGNA